MLSKRQWAGDVLFVERERLRVQNRKGDDELDERERQKERRKVYI
jgi:hypothetical protein